MGPAPALPRRSLELDDAALLRECEVDTYRASGPGGQKRNKTDSAVRLRHGPTGLMVIAEESRSQHENRRRALKRLRHLIALEVRQPVAAPPFRPGAALSACILPAGRLNLGRRDPRYPVVLGEVLDVLAACQMRVSEAAGTLGVTTANLVSFLADDPKAWAQVNRLRTARGLRPLRT